MLRVGCPTKQLTNSTDAIDHFGSRESLDSMAGNVTPLAASGRCCPRVPPFARVAFTGIVARGPGVVT